MSARARTSLIAGPRLWPLLVAAGLVGLANICTAETRRDPFGTAALTPAQPGTQGIAGDGPCRMNVPEHPLALVDVVDLALCRNPLTRETWASARVRAAEIGIAHAAYQPTVSANGTLDFGRTRASDQTRSERNIEADISLAWLLADFGARDAGLESARQLLAAAGATQDSRLQGLFLVTLEAYYEVHARHAAVLAAQESERAAKESLRAAATRYAVGTATPADRLQAQTAYSQAVLDRVRAEGELRAAQGRLANAMGLNASQPVLLSAIAAPSPNDPAPADIGRLIDDATRLRPDLLAAEAELKAARADIDAASAAFRPRISLSARAGMQDSSFASPTHSGSIGLNVRIPLFTGHEAEYRVRAAEARADAQAARHDQLRLQVSLDVWQSYQSLQTASEAIRTSQVIMQSAAQSEAVALGRYKAGVGNLIDLLNAQATHARARQQQVQAGLDWNLARAALAQAMGQLDGALLAALDDDAPSSRTNSKGSTQ